MTAAMLRYTTLRLLLFLVVLALLYVAGARDIVLVGLTVVISLGLSYVLLRGPRDRVARELVERHERRLAAGEARPPRTDTDEAVEDAADDARRARESAARDEQ